MHHHPFETGTPMIDSCMLVNKNQFWQVLSNHPVKMIMCGHVHGDYSIDLQNGARMEASPSTCIQWLKGTVEPAYDARIGYKIYYFEKNKYAAEAKMWNC
jgi:Icc protein